MSERGDLEALTDVERRLRAALAAEASSVRPRERLADTLERSRAASRERSALPRWFTPLAAAAAVAVVAGVVWATQAGRPAPTPPAAATASSPSSGSGGASSPSSTLPPGVTSAALPVYHVGPVVGTDGRYGLYREFDGTTVTGDGDAARVVAALRLAMHPGARTGAEVLATWRGTTVEDVRVSADLITVTLSGAGPGGLSAEQERLAVQQLVWTADAALGRGALPVTFTVADGSTSVFGRFPASARYTRPPKDGWSRDLAPIWVTSPSRGQRFAEGDPVVVEGQASVFEGTIQWAVLRAGSTVDNGFTTASEGAPGRGTYRADLGALPSGDYTLRVWESSPRDGTPVGTVEVPFSVG